MGQGLVPIAFTLTPEYSEKMLNEEVTLTLHAQRGLRPAPPTYVTFYVAEGPHEGREWAGVTDDQGDFSFTYKGERVGLDRIVFCLSELCPLESRVKWEGGPDLVIGWLWPQVVRLPVPDDRLRVEESTWNVGNLDAGRSTTRYYLSTDDRVDETDRAIYERGVPPLGIRGASDHTADVSLPGGLAPGVYHLIACADDDREIAEQSEDNNCEPIVVMQMAGISEVKRSRPPVAHDDFYETWAGQTLTVAAPGVLSNDTDPDPDDTVLSARLVRSPEHGAVNLREDGSFEYAPASGFVGEDTFVYEAMDDTNLSSQATVTIRVKASNRPPDCSQSRASPGSLWPPNHSMRAIAITGVTDPDGDPLTVTVLGVKADEPVDVQGGGDGNTCPDATLAPLQVRAERQGAGNGRVYHIAFQASDGKGGVCQGTVTVCVPHDQGGGAQCIDEGPLYDVTSCPP